MTAEFSKWSAKIKCNDVSTNSLNYYHKSYREKSGENSQIHQIPKTHVKYMQTIPGLKETCYLGHVQIRTNPCQTFVYTSPYQEGVIGEIDIY